MADFTPINWNNVGLKSMSQYFARVNPVPLDKTEIYYSYSDAQNYVTGSPIAFAGQIITVVDFAGSAITAYMVDIDKTLKPIATTAAEGDVSASIQALQSAITSLTTQVGEIENALYWETDEDLEITE